MDPNIAPLRSGSNDPSPGGPDAAAPTARSGPGWVGTALTLAGIVCLLGLIGVLLPRLLAEIQSYRQSRESARQSMPIGWIGVAPHITSARPRVAVLHVGDRVKLWAGHVPGVGAVWFDVTNMTIPFTDLGYGLGRDAIRAIDNPIWVGPEEEHARRLLPEHRVLGLVIQDQAYAFPIMLMRRVEVVNQRDGGQPRLVTYSVLQGRARVYAADLDGQPLSMGGSGWTYHNTFVLYDRTTQSLWSPQAAGLAAIAGPLKGRVLPLLETPHEVAWSDWLRDHPGSRLLIGADRKHAALSRDGAGL